MNDDAQLLRRYAEDRSESAFGELVSRHIDLVYSAALRLVAGDTHLAQDVAQTVFADLARKARALSRHEVLTGWLYQATRYAASKAVRTERRRAVREKEAVAMQELSSDANWEQLQPVLDEAMGRLGAKDRDAVLLRYFERKELRAVGDALGTSEEGARKRVGRALERLRRYLTGRGVTLSTATLATVLTGSAVQAAPAALAGAISTTVIAGVATAAAGSTFTLLNLMSMTKLKAGILSAAVVVVAGTSVVVQQQNVSRLRADNEMLRQKSQQLEQLRAENEPLAKLKVDADELERLRGDRAELMRLRGEVGLLRSDLKNAVSHRMQDKQIARDGDATPDPAPTVAKYRANVRANVGNGQTLATGGWPTEQGRHLLVFMTPQLEFGGDYQSVFVQAQLVDVPDSVLAALDLEALRTDAIESSLKEVFSAERADAILNALREAEGVNFLSGPRVVARDGQQAQISVTKAEVIAGETHTLGPIINFLPSVSSDGNSVEVAVEAEVGTLIPSPK